MDNHDLSQIVETVIKNVTQSTSETKMTLALARRLAVRVEKKAAEIGVNAVVAVSDAGAHPIFVECMDDSYIASYDIAVGKAYTTVALKMPTSRLKELAKPGESLYGIQFTNDGQIVIFGGGVPLKAGGKIIGGLGVSGGSEEQDTYLAEYGESIFDELIK